MTTKKPPGTTPLTVQLDAAKHRRLKTLAAVRGQSLRQLVEPLLDQALSDADRPEPGPAPRSP